jgi:tetratricopeptide (TPR) repeat protein
VPPRGSNNPAKIRPRKRVGRAPRGAPQIYGGGGPTSKGVLCFPRPGGVHPGRSMSFLRRLFDSRHRRARAAEGAGQWRRAAELWAAAGDTPKAASALLHLAERGGTLEERLAIWHDALRWVPASDEDWRARIQRKMALAVLEDARHRDAASAEEKRRLADAARRLEETSRPKEAAEAFGLLGQTEDQARNLEAAGEVDALEALLEKTSDEDAKARKLRRLVADYESALKYGARKDALAALVEATRLAPQDRSIGELRRRLEVRRPQRGTVRLRIDGRAVAVVGRLPCVLGRSDAELVVRGTGVSRRHAELALEDGRLVVRDLDSRNGTLVSGLPIARSLALTGETEIGLGDDVRVRVKPAGIRSLQLTVESGLDRGLRAVVGEGALALPGVDAHLHFDAGWPVFSVPATAQMTVDGQKVALPVHLLEGDRLTVDEVPVEVEA